MERSEYIEKNRESIDQAIRAACPKYTGAITDFDRNLFLTDRGYFIFLTNNQ